MSRFVPTWAFFVLLLTGCVRRAEAPLSLASEDWIKQGKRLEQAIESKVWIGLTKKQMEAELRRLKFRGPLRYPPKPEAPSDWQKEFWGTDFDQALYVGQAYPSSDLWVLFKGGKVSRAVTIYIE